jgi:putative PIN family toxin of toxin-antitoxin system
MTNLRIVLDTNIFISALLSVNSIPFQVMELVFAKHCLLRSEVTVNELKRVLFRKKFDRYITNEERYIFLAKFLTVAESIQIVKTFDVCRNVKDNCFLDLAVNGRANLIITGDDDLLTLNPFHEIEIIQPMAFLNRFNGGV